MADPDDKSEKRAAGKTKGPDDAGASGSIDVQFSGTALPAAKDSPGSSAAGERPPSKPRGKRAPTDGPRTPTLPGKLGKIEARIGERLSHIPEQLEHLEHKIGESISHLPVVPKTRRSRVLVRSVVVGFLLVFAWIAAIVTVQLRKQPPPDFRPLAEKVLVDMRDGRAASVYADASPRFQEIVLEERFVEDMADMQRALGRFVEITSVNETEVVKGPGGRTGRVQLRLLYEKGATKGNISFHWDENRWKVLGISIEMPPAVATVEGTREKREERVRAPPEIRTQVEETLALLRDGKSDAVWDGAAPVFQSSVSKQGLIELEKSRRDVLGVYRRILDVTSSRQNPGQTSASLDVLVEYDKAVVTATFGFARSDEGTWKLASYKLVLPKPRVPTAAR